MFSQWQTLKIPTDQSEERFIYFCIRQFQLGAHSKNFRINTTQTEPREIDRGKLSEPDKTFQSFETKLITRQM